MVSREACSPGPGSWSWLLPCLLGLAAALGLVLWAGHGWAVLSCPGQVDYGEGGTLVASLRLARGEALYPDPARPPYFVNPYAPLYLAAGAAFMGSGPTFLGGRLVSLSATLGVLGVLGLALRRRAGWTAALGGLAFFLVHPLVLGWSPFYRVDMLALFFEALGLVAAHRALERGPGKGADLVALGAMVLALFTRQSTVAGLAAFLAALALEDRRRALRALLFVLFLAGVPILALQAATGGWFLRIVVGFNLLPFDPGLALRAGLDYAGTVLGAGLLALGSLSRRHRLGWLYLAFSLPMAAGVGREGGFFNYDLELHLALCALAGLGLARWSGGGSRLRALAAGALAVLQVAALGFTSDLAYLPSPAECLRFETPSVLRGEAPAWVRDTRTAQELGPWLAAHPGPVLAENLGNPALYGRTPWAVDPKLLFALAETGRWDPEPLLERVDQGAFALILLQRLDDNLRFPPQAMRRILARYRAAGVAGADTVLVPR